jgi:hypothetical protein
MKRIIALTTLFVFLVIAPLQAAIVYESITVSTTAIGFTAASISGKTKAMCTLESQNIRFRIDGTAPTTTEGHILENGNILYIEGGVSMSNFSAIRDDAVDGTLKCTYEGD